MCGSRSMPPSRLRTNPSLPAVHIWTIESVYGISDPEAAIVPRTQPRGIDATPPMLRPDPGERRRKSGPALRAFFNIADRWHVTPEEQRGLLGWPSRSALYTWKANPDTTLSYDTLVRLSLILGIFKALQVLYPEPAFAHGWMKMPNRNALFGGRTPAEYALRGGIGALQDVRRLLDARRGGWN